MFRFFNRGGEQQTEFTITATVNKPLQAIKELKNYKGKNQSLLSKDNKARLKTFPKNTL